MDKIDQADHPSDGSPDNAVAPLSLDKRLELASEQRAKVLKKNSRQRKQKSPEHETSGLYPRIVRNSAFWLSRWRRGAWIPKAAIAFSAAFGLGLGGGLGVSLLSKDSDQLLRELDPATPIATSQTQSTEAVLATFQWAMSPYEAEDGGLLEKDKIIMVELQPVNDVPAVIQAVVPPAPPRIAHEQVALPSIQQVSYEASPRSDAAAALWADVPAVAPAPYPAGDRSSVKQASIAYSGVYVHAPVSVPVAKLQALANDVQSAGASVERVGRETFRVSQTHIRFFSPTTADQAQNLASSLGVEARDFVGTGPESNRIELWVAGRGPVRQQSLPRPTFLAQLFGRAER